MLIFLTILTPLCNGLNFSQLPNDVVSENIFGSLSIPDKAKSIAELNRAGLYHYVLYHNKEFRIYGQLINELRKADAFTNDRLEKIEELTKKLQFSELWSLMLPDTLKAVAAHLWFDASLILDAMNMHIMSLGEFNQVHRLRNSSSVELDILILSSRALIYYYAMEDYVEIDKSHHLMNLKIEEYPWLYYVLREGSKFHKHWAIYMTYLYEVTFDLAYKSANIPSLNCVYKHERISDKSDHERRKNLKDLMEYGLILWSRESIDGIRADYFAKNAEKTNKTNFNHLVLEGHAMMKEINLMTNKSFAFEVQYMTKYILDIAFKYNVSMNFIINMYSHNEQFGSFDMSNSIIEKYRYLNFQRQDFESFEQLSYLLIKIGDIIRHDFLIMDYLAETQINAAYINATFNVLCRYRPKLSRKYLKDLLIKIIIRRAQTYFDTPCNRHRAKIEVRKLANDALFRKDTLKIIYRSSTNRRFAARMIEYLCDLRSDWLFMLTLLKGPCSK